MEPHYCPWDARRPRSPPRRRSQGVVAVASVNHPGGEQVAEFDSEFLRAGGPECLERAGSADSGSRRPSLAPATPGKTGLNQPSDQRLGARSGNEPTAVREASWCHLTSASPVKGAPLGLPGERPWAEAAPRHEGGHGEIDQVPDDRGPLATAQAHDHRASKQQHRTGSSQRHQNRRDAERGGHDQAGAARNSRAPMALRAPGLKSSTHLEAAPPIPASFSLGTNSLVLLATRKATARIPVTIHRARFSFGS